MRWIIGLVLGMIGTASLLAQTPPEKPRYETRERGERDPDGINKFYLGRQIAYVMGHQASGWLERPEREKEEDPTKLLEALAIKPGQSIADVGAGSGYHTLRMSKLVGDTGRIYAVDIQKEMLEIIDARTKKAKITNVSTVLGTNQDPKLPEGKLDLILMVDVYHEFEFPYEMTEKMAAALAPGGRLAFVEFRLEDPKVPIKLVHKMSERQVIREMEQFTSLEHTKTISTLPWQHIILFTKKAK
ncbi:MAG: class I SAM-dependent methyltransferase [Gemmataceae bacterium]